MRRQKLTNLATRPWADVGAERPVISVAAHFELVCESTNSDGQARSSNAHLGGWVPKITDRRSAVGYLTFDP